MLVSYENVDPCELLMRMKWLKPLAFDWQAHWDRISNEEVGKRVRNEGAMVQQV